MRIKTLTTFVAAAVLAASSVCANAAELPESVQIVSEADADLLLRVAMGEAGNQEIDGMRYVISTVLNRVDDSRFPDTISEVCKQKYQFYTGYTGTISDDCREALQQELQQQINREVLWFSSSGWPAYGTHALQYKDHYFNK